uniref:Uncharacterized protein n=1 Tax=Anguilla anguilla TaxID=7936 RepID=A0A0E9W2Y4_ANGAN
MRQTNWCSKDNGRRGLDDGEYARLDGGVDIVDLRTVKDAAVRQWRRSNRYEK